MLAEDTAQLGGRYQPQFEAELPEGDGRAPGVLRREHLGELLGREEAGLPQEFPQGDFPWSVLWHMTPSSRGHGRAPERCSVSQYHPGVLCPATRASTARAVADEQCWVRVVLRAPQALGTPA
jgi:hypothetical protein